MILSKKQILTSIKGRNSVANFQKMALYNPNVDLVNNNVYTKFCSILSMHSQDIEQNPNSDIKGRKSVSNFRKLVLNNPNVDFINDQRTYGPVNAHVISGPRISTKHTKPGKNKVKK